MPPRRGSGPTFPGARARAAAPRARPGGGAPGPGAYGTFQQEAYAAALEDAYGGDPDCAQRLIVAAWLYGLR